MKPDPILDSTGVEKQGISPMTEPREHLVDWLVDAHAMAQQAEQQLTAQARRIEHYPRLKARLEQHIEETVGQRRLLEARIVALGATPSRLKDALGRVAALGQALGGLLATDEVVKGALASYAFEHLEIAAHTALMAAARTVGDLETQRICGQILAQDTAMAQWLGDHLAELTEEFLVRGATPGVEARK